MGISSIITGNLEEDIGFPFFRSQFGETQPTKIIALTSPIFDCAICFSPAVFAEYLLHQHSRKEFSNNFGSLRYMSSDL